MKTFIALSPSSKKALQVAQMSASLPVNILIFGEKGVGKKLLASMILPHAQSFEAKELEKLIIENKISLEQFDSLIVYNFHKTINKNEFLDKLHNIRVVVTSLDDDSLYSIHFPVKIEIPPLKQRDEDLKELKKIYIQEASDIYSIDSNIDEFSIDLSANGITLKQSIYKSVLLCSMTQKDLDDILYNFFIKELTKEKDYKSLLELFEIPLLNAAKKVWRSQLKMSEKLKINRITLRKKLTKYFGE